MPLSLGAISAQLGIDTTGYSRGILTANALTHTFGQNFTTFLTNPVLAGINALNRLGRRALRSGEELLATAESMQRLADQTDVAASAIHALGLQNELAGSTAEIAQRFIRNFSTRLGQAERGATALQEALDELGVTTGGNVNDAFREAVRALAVMEDAQRRNALAAQLFGEEAGPLVIQTLREFGGDIDAVVQKYRELGSVTDDLSNEKLATLNTNLGLVQQAMRGVGDTAIREFILGLAGDTGDAQENIQQLAKILNEEVAPAAKATGEAVAGLVRSLQGLSQSDTVEGAKVLAGLLGRGQEAVVSRIGDSVALAQKQQAEGTLFDIEFNLNPFQGIGSRERARAGQ